MGYIREQYTSVMALGAPNVNTWEIQEGILYSLTVSIFAGTTAANECWVLAGIADQDTDPTNLAAGLINQPFGSQHPAMWTGRHPIITGNWLIIYVTAPAATQIRCVWLQLMPDASKSSREVLDA